VLLSADLIIVLLCVRYLRREIAADVGPQLRQINLKIETIESVIHLALATRYAELASSPSRPMANDPS